MTINRWNGAYIHPEYAGFAEIMDPDGEKKEIRWDLYLNQFNVLRLNVIDFMKSWSCVEEMLSYLQDEVTTELVDAYPEIRYGRVIDLETVMRKIHEYEIYSPLSVVSTLLTRRLEKYKKNPILVGINYDKEVSKGSKSFKHHSCVIERT